jgi:hypothetical protein
MSSIPPAAVEADAGGPPGLRPVQFGCASAARPKPLRRQASGLTRGSPGTEASAGREDGLQRVGQRAGASRHPARDPLAHAPEFSNRYQ